MNITEDRYTFTAGGKSKLDVVDCHLLHDDQLRRTESWAIGLMAMWQLCSHNTK